MPAPTTLAAEGYGVSAGLDLLSGVFGYLTSLSASSVAKSRADLMRTEAEANAQRYAEQAVQFEAHQKSMYLSSGVTLQGSPIDALATTARIATENIDAIRMAGENTALSQEIAGQDAESRGRNAILGGLKMATGYGIKAANVGPDTSKADALNALAGSLIGGK